MTGPWTKIADEAKLAASGSALAVGSGYGVGVQAWYNQDLAVDPANPNHVYAGLEEVFESTNARQHLGHRQPVLELRPGLRDQRRCPNTTHPDQHAMMIADGKIVIGNDGGVYSRPLSDDQQYGDWTDLNATLRNLQYYDARAGKLGDGHRGVGRPAGQRHVGAHARARSQMAEPAGGDGFYVIVDPRNANRMVGEYTDGAMYSSTDGGHTFADYVSPTCAAQDTVGDRPRPGLRSRAPGS